MKIQLKKLIGATALVSLMAPLAHAQGVIKIGEINSYKARAWALCRKTDVSSPTSL